MLRLFEQLLGLATGCLTDEGAAADDDDDADVGSSGSSDWFSRIKPLMRKLLLYRELLLRCLLLEDLR